MKRVKEEPRDQVMSYKATMAERRLIETQAKKQGTSPGAYMRGAILMSLCIDGEKEAMGILFREVGETLFGRLNAWRTGSFEKTREA